MRLRLYQIFVNRVPGIRQRYLQKRQGKKGLGHLGALVFLLWLNVQYYLLFRRRLGEPSHSCYEEKTLYHCASESSLSLRESPEVFARKLASYDVISFDVFDTLLLRFFSDPADVFYLIGMELDYPDFRRIRTEAEAAARRKKKRTSGTAEVTLEEIWAEVERLSGIPRQTGIRLELEWESKCCYANPYLLRVVLELQKYSKPVIAVSDMYAGGRVIQHLLSQSGYPAFSRYFVSCDYESSKHEGSLYEEVKRVFGPARSYVHVGDQKASDCRQAMRHGIQALWYPNVNHVGNVYRPEDMSAVIGSLYRGIVNGAVHNGLCLYSREYEYGFIYGGLFVFGYCQFIHHYVRSHGIEKILFLSRDGDVLLKAYLRMYPEEASRVQYVYWSRLAAVKLSAQYYRHDYFLRFLFHKTDQHFSLRRIFREMELSDMLPGFCARFNISPSAFLTHKNAVYVKKYLISSWDDVLRHYQEQSAAGELYYRRVLKDCRSAAAVDIGWAGSGAVMLDCAVNRLWKIGCRITGILAGSNSLLTPQSDSSESFFLSGKLVSYLYSQQQNRDLWKFHDPSKGHNLYWELLLGSPQGSLRGFYLGKNGKCQCRFKENKKDAEKIKEIHRGILDFTDQFKLAQSCIGRELLVSGRDAYAPMLNIFSPKNKKFMEGLEELTDEIHIG